MRILAGWLVTALRGVRPTLCVGRSPASVGNKKQCGSPMLLPAIKPSQELGNGKLADKSNGKRVDTLNAKPPPIQDLKSKNMRVTEVKEIKIVKKPHERVGMVLDANGKVLKVEPNFAAHRAGIKVKDKLVKVYGIPWADAGVVLNLLLTPWSIETEGTVIVHQMRIKTFD